MFDVYEDEAYRCVVEDRFGRAFFHVEVKKELTKTDIRRGRQAFGEIKHKVEELGYELLYSLTPSPHFARLLGGEFTSISTIIEYGVTLELIVWELKQD